MLFFDEFLLSLASQLNIRELYLFTGSGQNPPSQCVHNLQVEYNRIDLYIMPGVVNCFSCALDNKSDITWQVSLPNHELIPVSSSPDAVTDGNFLVILMPEMYVLPGTSGRRGIVCTSLFDGRILEARLASPSIREIFTCIILLLLMMHYSPTAAIISQCQR